MINRVLIRIKVVQMLYSYLLTRSEFKIESAPGRASRDGQFAYSVYLDLLLLILELSGYRAQPAGRQSPMAGVADNKYLKDNRVAKFLAADPMIRDIILKNKTSIADFDDAVPALYKRIVESSAYRSYVHTRERDIKDDVQLWTALISSVVFKSPEFMAAARKNPDFTNVGLNHGINMLLSTLDSYSDSTRSLIEARNSLDRSLDKAYELYHALLLLIVEITHLQAQRLDANRHKYLPTADDLNPNMRFVDNALPRLIEECGDMDEYLKANPITWANDPMLVRSLLDSILASDIYREYMEQPTTDREADCEFWRMVFKNIILPSDELAEALESKSVYWNDDLDIMSTFVLKTIKRFATTDGCSLLPKYKDDEDARFGRELFGYAVDNYETYRGYIDKFIDDRQWDPERLAFMDIVVMVTAIGELLNFPAIPIPVTLNEYIEIANSYSTPRSGQFINGILYSVINYLKGEGLLLKN